MCFKSPKMPAPVKADTPAISETTAPEPQAVVFGGSDETNSTELGAKVEGIRKKGTGSLTIKKEPVAPDTTGANRALNTSR